MSDDLTHLQQVKDLYSDDPGTFVEFLGGRYRRKEGVTRLYVGRFADSFVNGRNGPVWGFLLDHPQMQDIVDINEDGTRAWGRFRALMSAGVHESIAATHPRGIDSKGRPRQWWEGGLYENEYIKENGVWKIFRLRYFPFWHGEFADGWSYTKPNYVPFPTVTYPEDPLGPDQLVEQKMLWPDTRVIPFHYPHPVTGNQVAPDDLKAPIYGQPPVSDQKPLSIEDPDEK